MIFLSFFIFLFHGGHNNNFILGKSGHVARQYFPYVSSESDLQRYKAIPFRQNSVNNNNDQNGSSSLSNVPSDYKSDRIKVRFCRYLSFPILCRRRQVVDGPPLNLIERFYFLLFFLLQDNGSAKYFQGSRHTPNMGEKVAQVNVQWYFLLFPRCLNKRKLLSYNFINVNWSQVTHLNACTIECRICRMQHAKKLTNLSATWTQSAVGCARLHKWISSNSVFHSQLYWHFVSAFGSCYTLCAVSSIWKWCRSDGEIFRCTVESQQCRNSLQLSLVCFSLSRMALATNGKPARHMLLCRAWPNADGERFLRYLHCTLCLASACMCVVARETKYFNAAQLFWGPAHQFSQFIH